MPRRLTKSYKEHLFERLQTPKEVAGYLNAAIEERDIAVFLLALRDVADAQGIGKVAAEAKLNRENVYRMLSHQGNPTLASLLRVLYALGMELQIKPAATQCANAVTTVTAKLLGTEGEPEQFQPVPDQNRGNDYESAFHTTDESLAA